MEQAKNDSGALLLSIQMIADAMNERGWDFVPQLAGDTAQFRRWQFFEPGIAPETDTLYLLPPGGSEQFPTDTVSFIAGGSITGNAPNLHGINRPVVEIANMLLSVFDRYHRFETAMNHVVSGGGTLTDLCRAAEDFFHNPIFIHDNMFVLIGYPRDIATTDQFARNAKTGLFHLPMSRIDEFRFDPEFIRSYQERKASIWFNKSTFRSIFVNLFDGDQLYGRLLINERQSALCPGHLKAAEYLAQYAMMIIRRDAQRSARSSYSFQDTFIGLALGQPVPEDDCNAALSILGWRRNDRFLCLRLRGQDSAPPISPIIAVQSALSMAIKCSFSFLYQGEICLLVDLSQSVESPPQIIQRLAAPVRDNFLFCGISNPFHGLELFPAAFRQAAAAQEYAAKSPTGTWLVSFEKCALEYIEDTVSGFLPPNLVAAPELLKLQTYDKERATDYYQTLRAYIYNACDIPATAKALIIHRTTLTYRLEKIRELIPLELEEPNHRLYLQLSFHLLNRAEAKQSAT